MGRLYHEMKQRLDSIILLLGGEKLNLDIQNFELELIFDGNCARIIIVFLVFAVLDDESNYNLYRTHRYFVIFYDFLTCGIIIDN